MATLKDIAEIAQVSEAAVSMALRGKKGVSEETARRIHEIAVSLNYRPNLLARGLATGATHIIGLVVPDIENPYYSSLVSRMTNALHRMGFHVILGVSNENPMLERQVVDNFVDSKVAGIIIAPINVVNNHTHYLQKYYESGTPIVFVTSYYPNTDIPYAMVDLERGAYELTTYLLQNGHRRIYYLIGDRRLLANYKRVDGYVRAFQDYSLALPRNPFIECNYVTFDGAYNAIFPLLYRTDDIDAIITTNDIMALGVLRALQEQNISVPKDIAVAGFDNTLFSTIGSLPLTTVSQNIEQMCQATISILMKQLAGDAKVSSAPLLPPELVIRRTTGVKSDSIHR